MSDSSNVKPNIKNNDEYPETTEMHPNFCTPQRQNGLCDGFVSKRSPVLAQLERSRNLGIFRCFCVFRYLMYVDLYTKNSNSQKNLYLDQVDALARDFLDNV